MVAAGQVARRLLRFALEFPMNPNAKSVAILNPLVLAAHPQ